MAWISVHEQIDGMKLRQFRKSSGCSKCEAVGMLVTLWLWGINNADRNGELKGADKDDLKEMYEHNLTPGIPAASIVDALITSGWIDEHEGQLFIHDWEDWQKQWYTALDRREKDKERKRNTAQISSSTETPRKLHGNSVENPQNFHGDSSATVTVTVTKPSPSSSPSFEEEIESMTPSPIIEPIPIKTVCRKFGEYGWVKLTDQQHQKLLRDLGEPELKRCIKYIDESSQATGNKNKWKDWNLVIRKCSSNGWGLKGGRLNGEAYNRSAKPNPDEKYADIYNQ